MKNNKENKKKYKKDRGKNTKTRKVILGFIELIFLCLIIFSTIKIYDWYKDNKNNIRQIEEISRNITVDNNEYNVDFNSLKEKNPDTVAWLKVEGTRNRISNSKNK